MKNAYLNSVFTFRLYLRTIQKNKKILLINRKKTKNKKSLSKSNHNTYLLNFEDEDRIRDWEEKNIENSKFVNERKN